MGSRSLVHSCALKLFLNPFRGGANFTSLKGSDIRAIYDLYDMHVLGAILARHCEAAKIRFVASKRKSGPVSSLFVHEDSAFCYILDVAPNILYALSKNSDLVHKVTEAIGIPVDRLLLLQVILEHQITNLMCRVWKCPQNYTTLHKRYFKYSPIRQVEETLSNVETSIPTNPGLFSNFENSCYLDSLLMILLTGKSPVFRETISSVSSRFTKQNGKLRLSLLEDLKNIKNRDQRVSGVLTCKNTRDILSTLIPQMKEGGSYCMFSAPEVYSVLTDVFPKLKIQVDVVVHGADGVAGKKERVKRELALFQFWDFMDTYTESTKFEKIMWHSVGKNNNELLVFQNGGMPPVTKFGDKSPETIGGKTYTKRDCFSERLVLGGKEYELFGIVILHGTSPGKDGGIHYTSFIKRENGVWWHYNDIGPQFTPMPKQALNFLFEERPGYKPEMYFYGLASSEGGI